MRNRVRVAVAVAAVVGGLVLPTTAVADPARNTVSDRVFDEYLSRAVTDTGVPGLSAVITRGGEIVHAAGYGRDSAGAAVTERTPMRIASLTKAFTATAVMILLEDGAIGLDRPVVDQLPEFRTDDPRSDRITVRQLLNQTSGLSDRGADIRATESAGSLAEYTATLRTARLTADPGTRWAYTNVNYNLAARLVEVASGTDFGAFLRQRIFTPLDMPDSALGDDTITPTQGFNSLFGRWIARDELPAFLDDSGSGGVITTAADMGRWLITQSGDGQRLVSAESLALMHAPTPVRDYGMGWGLDTDHGAPLLTHSGNLFTYTSAAALDPSTGYGYAVFANSAALHDATYEILTGLVALGRGEQPAETGNARRWTEGALAALTLGALGLGITGVVRAGGWARRRRTSRWWTTTLRCVPAPLPILLFACYPQLVSVLTNGRTVTWAQLTYFAAPLSIALLACACAGAVTLAARLIRLRSLSSAR
ncbi:serine hydrolase domain-containing protein [Nocardia sp. AG03]|uniref:serine hydrolase domain-containing protein n=1 Tax=Nocardia sp. AG03 TaxID=3025312 RepID=UPI00241834B0|nr:serine hydrolase domain-containing protein [Nocardia sp. AG03]